MSQVSYFILGTSSMLAMIIAIIWFVYSYQRKLSLRNAEYKAIEELMQRNELKSAYAVIEGQERERKRIAAELHDNIGGLMSTLHIFSDLAHKETSIEDVKRLNSKVNEVSLQLITEIRKLAYELDLRTLSGFGLRVALEQLCESIHALKKLDVVSIIDLKQPIEDIVSMNLYRIIQELFTNTLKHAQAGKVRLELAEIESELTLIYEDNGKGFDTRLLPIGMGLENIRKRTQAINGQLTMDSSQYGTTFIIEIKL
ncbi:MAG: ATP-binding protein [Bacteroidota bacterium]